VCPPHRFPRDHRSFGVAVFGVILVFLAVSPAMAAPASAPFSIHLKVSGGYRYSGSLTSFFSNFDYFCAMTKEPGGIGTYQYGLYFGLSRLNNALKGNFSKDLLVLTVQRYKPTIARYHDPVHDQITLVVRRHAYSSAGLIDPRYRVTVQVARDGLSGSFSMSHVPTMGKFRGKPVNVQGAWTCDTVLRG
jgi:hypothetical protein